MPEDTKEGQIDSMWEEHVHGGWWNLYTYYHRRYRGEAWPPEAREEVEHAKAAAHARPQGKKAVTEATALPCLAELFDR
jgi:hypothetical protein